MAEKEADKKSIWSQLWIYGIFAITIFMIYFTFGRPFEIEVAIYFQEVILIVLAIIGFIVFLLVSRKFNWLSTKPGQIMFLIAIGLLLWGIAESVWMGYEIAGEDPFPSIADVFYIAGYVPFALGLFLNIRTIKVKFKPAVLIIWLAISIAILLGILFVEVIPFLSEAPEFTTVITIIYPLADFVIIMLALVIILKFRAGDVAKPWAILLAGFILEALGDIWFTYADWMETYQPAYDIADLFFALGYIAMIASGLLFLWIYRSD
ncbi:MAG: hypothetical protein EU536_03405 [Promethearchaeota archaeon]|nr:MAG: hypothetical protein EU536_03405 [Candidatus Lokiarchaeota archaeon]